MKKYILTLLLCLFSVSLVGAAEKPSEESLIKAWEQIQKSNPDTVMFDKIKDRHYKFKITLIPFDGELKINDATIDAAMMMGPYNNYIMAVLDVELVGLPKETIMKNRKYAIWARSNTLYYDKKAGKWLSLEEFQNEIAKINNESSSSNLFSNYVLLAFLILALAYVLNFLRKNRQAVKTSLERQADSIALVDKSIALSEKGIQLSEETNKLLRDILAELKNKA